MKTPEIPMTPQALPQQRLNLVTDLPPRPEGFDVVLPEMDSPSKYGDCAWNLPADNLPKRLPKGAAYLFQAEWASSPMHNWIDAYYLSINRRRSHWLLWVSTLNDGGPRWTWESSVHAYAPRVTKDPHVAAVWLVALAWQQEAEEWYASAANWIDEAGDISVAEIKAIYRYLGW